MINELFDQYDSIKGMYVENDDEKNQNENKSNEILDKIKFIQNELGNNTEINILD